MESFDDLDLRPELIEALASEGIEGPTPVQMEAVPVVRRRRSVVLEAGSGSGAVIACALGVLDPLEPDAEGTRAVFLGASRAQVEEIALSLARLAQATGHRVAGLGTPWALPEHAHVLVATPPDLRDAVEAARVKLDRVDSVCLLGLGELTTAGMRSALEVILNAVPPSAQRVFTALPLRKEDRSFAEAHARRLVFIPSDAGVETSEEAPARGELRYRVAAGEDTKDAEIPHVVADLAAAGHTHVVLHFRSADRAADVGDELGLRGYGVGPPGDRDVPVWLALDPLEARARIGEVADEASVATVSVDVPPDPDVLDRRHSGGAEALAVVTPRELEHLRRSARHAGYALKPAPGPRPADVHADVESFLARVRQVFEREDLAPHVLLLEPLFHERSPAEVAGALSLLLRSRREELAGVDARETPAGARGGDRPAAWVKVFLSLGEKDGVRPGDLLGAITGETGIEGSKVGRIEIRETFSRVDVEEGVAERVIGALNGTTLRGRSVRADYDRGDRARARDPGRGPRRGATPGGPAGRGGKDRG